MHKLKIPFAFALMIFIAACQTLGIPEADTINKRIVVANGTIESIANTISTLVDNGRISHEQAETYVGRLKEGATGVDLVRKLKDTNPAEASQRLDAVVVALSLLKNELEAREQ